MRTLSIIALLLSCSTLFSCSVSNITYKNHYDKEITKNATCPDLKIKANTNQSVSEFKINSIDVLPIIVDTQLNYPDSVDWELRESLKSKIQPIIIEGLNQSGVNVSDNFYGEDFLAEDNIDYRNKIRHFSFGLAHDMTETKKNYPETLKNYGNENYKLGFLFQVFPKEMNDRIYIHLLTFDVNNKEIVYYDYLIYTGCSINDVETFKSLTNSMIANFKARHFNDL
jgi:hypothetical protein